MLRSMWEFAAIANFCHRISKFESGLRNITTLDIENAILNPISNRLLATIILSLMHRNDWASSVQYIIENDYNVWKQWLCTYMTDHYQDFFVDNPWPIASMSMLDLNVKQRVKILLALCEWKASSDDIKHEMSNDPELLVALRPEPLGYDDDGNMYWYITEDCWLFKESAKDDDDDENNNEDEDESIDPNDDRNQCKWEVIATTLPEIEYIVNELKKGRNHDENHIALIDTLEENILPQLHTKALLLEKAAMKRRKILAGPIRKSRRIEKLTIQQQEEEFEKARLLAIEQAEQERLEQLEREAMERERLRRNRENRMRAREEEMLKRLEQELADREFRMAQRNIPRDLMVVDQYINDQGSIMIRLRSKSNIEGEMLLLFSYYLCPLCKQYIRVPDDIDEERGVIRCLKCSSLFRLHELQVNEEKKDPHDIIEISSNDIQQQKQVEEVSHSTLTTNTQVLPSLLNSNMQQQKQVEEVSHSTLTTNTQVLPSLLNSNIQQQKQVEEVSNSIPTQNVQQNNTLKVPHLQKEQQQQSVNNTILKHNVEQQASFISNDSTSNIV